MTVYSKERRRDKRLNELGTVFIELPEAASEADRILICNSVDVSANGLRVNLDRALDISSIVQLSVALGGAQKPFHLVAETRWCVQASANVYRAGFQILHSDGTDLSEWQAVLATL